MVGAPRFELGTPSPPDWCANRAALRSAGTSGPRTAVLPAFCRSLGRRPPLNPTGGGGRKGEGPGGWARRWAQRKATRGACNNPGTYMALQHICRGVEFACEQLDLKIPIGDVLPTVGIGAANGDFFGARIAIPLIPFTDELLI